MKTWDIFEYLLIISPSEEISRSVVKIKRTFAERYNCTMAAHLTPHITMCEWLDNNSFEALIISKIRGFAETVNPFVAQLNGLGNFDPKTIFVTISNQKPFSKITSGLKSSILHLLKNEKSFSTPAHMTIARSMDPDQFIKAWEEWKDELFKASFSVTEMILLRRHLSKERRSKYEMIDTFPFYGKKPLIEQFELVF